MTALVWLRRDLRVHDHPALDAALRSAETVVPVFCLDERLLHGRHSSGPRTQFLLECLGELDAALRDRGSRLVIRMGPPERELVKLAEVVGAESLHLSVYAGPFARRRDLRVRDIVRRAGIEFCPHPGMFVADRPAAITTRAEKPYTVFTPYYRAWLATARRAVLAASASLPPLPSRISAGKIPTLVDLGLEQEATEPATGGEQSARAALERFLSGGAERYHQQHDLPAEEGTSRLSPYLHFGCISPREVEARLGPGPGPQAFRRQLCWRDFYAQVIHSHPGNARSEYQERYRGKLRWSHAHARFEAWSRGRTGFPLVDAGMRQLLLEGWMHNRVRLVVGSFLTKDLGIDWRWGERWFMRRLIDGDEANNNGNWQWIASVGVDPQPAFRRIYNPARHQERFDPDGRYIRRFVPELERVPARFLAEPWKMPAEAQRESACVIGAEYPAPIVDHLQARREALERYAAAG
jgi:deoxyribodipyrimidine photo-lyase